MNTFRDMVVGIMQLFVGETSAISENEGYVDTGELIYNSGFNALKYAVKPNTDYFQQIDSGQLHFARSLENLCSLGHRSEVQKVLSSLQENHAIALKELIQAANIHL